MQQVTLQAGDYVATEGMTKERYHTVAQAFINAGANEGEYPSEIYFQNYNYIGWSRIKESVWHQDSKYFERTSGRLLTVDQVLNATNAGGWEADTQNWTPADLFKNGDGEWGQREGDCYVTRTYKDGKLIKTTHHELNDLTKASEETDMHITDKLCKARRERDKAQARYEQALAEHREAYPWLLIEERKQPTDDMTDPANWRAGDWLECVAADKSDLTVGRLYQVKSMGGAPVIDDDDDDDISRPAEYFRFHSRPK